MLVTGQITIQNKQKIIQHNLWHLKSFLLSRRSTSWRISGSVPLSTTSHFNLSVPHKYSEHGYNLITVLQSWLNSPHCTFKAEAFFRNLKENTDSYLFPLTCLLPSHFPQHFCSHSPCLSPSAFPPHQFRQSEKAAGHSAKPFFFCWHLALDLLYSQILFASAVLSARFLSLAQIQ